MFEEITIQLNTHIQIDCYSLPGAILQFYRLFCYLEWALLERMVNSFVTHAVSITPRTPMSLNIDVTRHTMKVSQRCRYLTEAV